MSNGTRTYGERVGVRHDVTADFYHVLLGLADMLDVTKQQSSFVFKDENGSPAYEVTLKKIKEENQ